MSRVVHFEIHASEPQALIEFYKALLGWSFTKWAGPVDYWVVETGPADQPGINGGLLPRHGAGPVEGQPVTSYVCTAGVAALDETIAKATSLGGTVALPKMPIPGVGWLAYIKDPDGNLLGLMQADEKAA
jgi:predicted enzyme related to lactoylglutathione lyase